MTAPLIEQALIIAKGDPVKAATILNAVASQGYQRAPRIEHGDSLEVLPRLAAEGVMFDACVTDPPYHLTSIVKRFGGANAAPAQHGTDGAYARASRGFMGKTWDGGDVAFRPETWALVAAVMKPGAHLLAFSGTRTYHRMVCAIEDAGFEIRDQIGWLYGSGFPKSHDVSKGIDKKAGAEREVIRERYTAKRIKSGATVVREGGYGKQDINFTATDTAPATADAATWQGWGTALKPAWEPIVLARKPLIGTVAANVLAHGTGALNIDGCRVGSTRRTPASQPWGVSIPVGRMRRLLIAYLARLITPPGGLILDPFAGSGTLGMACLREGFRCVLIEREEEYYRDILKRIDHVRGADTPLFAGATA